MTRVSGPRRDDYHEAIERLFQDGTTSGLSEAQLLERFAARRDGAAFAALVERHGPMVLGVCRRFLNDPNDVDDAFQAVFLVLVRKAHGLRSKELLGNWLFGVACRVAARARSTAARRQAKAGASGDAERLAVDRRRPPDEEPWEAASRDERRSWLHEEVERLPRRYRAPVVAFYFEGRSYEEAASLLNCPLGTIKGRLSRARDLLRKRLERRGLAVPAVALTSRLASPELRAAVPASLAQTTVRSGLSFAPAASLMTTSAIPTSVRTLTQGVLHAMVVTQIKAVAIPTLLVAAGVLTAGARVAARQDGDKRAGPAPAIVQPPAGSVQPASSSGRVLVGDLIKDPTSEVILDGDLDYLRKLEEWGQEYQNLKSRLEIDMGSRSDPGTVRGLHRAQVATLLRSIEKEKPGSKAGQAVMSAFVDYLNEETERATAGKTYVFYDFALGDSLHALASDCSASLQTLRADLQGVDSPEVVKAARDRYKDRLDGLARSYGEKVSGERARSLRRLYDAYVIFRRKLDFNPGIQAIARGPESAKPPATDALADRENEPRSAEKANSEAKEPPNPTDGAPQDQVDDQSSRRRSGEAPTGAEPVEVSTSALTRLSKQVENLGSLYNGLTSRLAADFHTLGKDADKQKLGAMHRARVEGMLRALEDEPSASAADREIKTVFCNFVKKTLENDTETILSQAVSPNLLPSAPRLVFFERLAQEYQDSLQKLQYDLQMLRSPEDKATARELHGARLANLARSVGQEGTPMREIYDAYLAILEKTVHDPEYAQAASRRARTSRSVPQAKTPEQPKPPVEQVANSEESGDKAKDASGDAKPSIEATAEAHRVMIARTSAALSRIDTSPLNVSALKALERPMTLRTNEKSTLDDLLKQIRATVRTADGVKVPVYVDPVGLRQAGASLSSHVALDLEDVPLKFSLRLMLKQLGLAYCVRDGVLIISSLEGIHNELAEAQSEQMGLYPEKFPQMGLGGGMGGMGMGGMGGMGGGMGMM